MDHEQARAIIDPFYDLFRTPKRDWDAGLGILTDDWRSYYTNNDWRSKTDTRPYLEGLFEIVPDIDVEILQWQVDGDIISVRSELSGTPVKEFMVPYSGKRFSIMTIDLHKVRDGKLCTLWHLEDWGTAIRQLSK